MSKKTEIVNCIGCKKLKISSMVFICEKNEFGKGLQGMRCLDSESLLIRPATCKKFYE